MRVSRESLLRSLESVTPGLASAKETVVQSSCFIFRQGEDGAVLATFNDEVACMAPSPLGDEITGAVPAKPLLALLGKMTEDEVEVSLGDGEIIVKGRGRRSGIRMESEVVLQIDSIERPNEWVSLEPEFADAVSIVLTCASTNDNMFVLTCVHIHPEYLEACDNLQLSRYAIRTGVTEPCLVRRDSLKHLSGFGPVDVATTPAWIHFRNAGGNVLSCRRWVEDYENLTPVIEGAQDGAERVSLPTGLDEIVSRAEVFSSEAPGFNRVLVSLQEGRICVRGEGPSGWFEERKKLQYAGPAMSFYVAPKLLSEITKAGNECLVTPTRLFVDSGNMAYVACTHPPE